MAKIRYTNINHEAREQLGLDITTYCIASSIYTLANNPKSISPGWCTAKRQYLADWLGISKRSVQSKIMCLVELDLVVKDDDTNYLKTTKLWYDTVEVNRGANIAPHEQNLHPTHADSASSGVQSLHPSINNVYININNSNDIEEKKLFFKNILINAGQWQEHIKVLMSIKASYNFEPDFEEFIIQAIGSGKTYTNDGEVKSHFFYWFRKNKLPKIADQAASNGSFNYKDKELVTKLHTKLLNALLVEDLGSTVKVRDIQVVLSTALEAQVLHKGYDFIVEFVKDKLGINGK